MKRVLFGDKNVGVQGIYYFEDPSFVDNFAAKIKPFLDSLRSGTSYWEEFMDEWKHETFLYNFLRECKRRVEVELETPEVWWEPGGSLYGEKWHNVELPNGRGKSYIGDRLIESDEDDDSEAPSEGIPGLKLCLYKLAKAGVVSTEELDSILSRIEANDAVSTAWEEFAKRLKSE